MNKNLTHLKMMQLPSLASLKGGTVDGLFVASPPAYLSSSLARDLSLASLKGGRVDGLLLASPPAYLTSSLARDVSRVSGYRHSQVSVHDAVVRPSRLDPKQTRKHGNVLTLCERSS